MSNFVFKTNSINNLESYYDAIVIGSGGAGLSAAIQAHELGLKVAILEKNNKLGGNTSRASSGMNAAETNIQYQQGIIDSMTKFYQETLQGGGQLNDPDMLHFFVEHAPLAIAWLKDHNILLNELTITGGMTIKRTHRPASKEPIGNFLITNLLKEITKQHINVFNNAKVVELIHNEKDFAIKLENGQLISAKVVILATGGFGASKEIIKKYRPDLLSYKTTNQDGSTGDGLKLATKIGAQLIQMNFIQVHPTAQTDNKHTYLIGEAVRGEGAILINQAAARFVNELDTRKIVANAITNLHEDGAWLILDQEIRNHVKALEFYDAVGLVKTGQTISELANAISISPQALIKTIQRWNQAIAQNNDVDYHRTTGLERPIATAPYFAIHVHPAIHYTMGGIHIDQHARVLDISGNIIKGFYAAGEVTGGLHGNNRIGGNSITETIVFGREAAIQAAKYILSK